MTGYEASPGTVVTVYRVLMAGDKFVLAAAKIRRTPAGWMFDSGEPGVVGYRNKLLGASGARELAPTWPTPEEAVADMHGFLLRKVEKARAGLAYAEGAVGRFLDWKRGLPGDTPVGG